jgi:hypothetical protein
MFAEAAIGEAALADEEGASWLLLLSPAIS